MCYIQDSVKQKKKLAEEASIQGRVGSIAGAAQKESDFAHRKEYISLKYPLPAFHKHMLNAFPANAFREAVRQLYSERTLWLVASWDMYSDEFIRCLEHQAGSSKVWVQLNLAEYKGIDYFFENVNNCLGFRLQEFCAILASHPDHAVLIDNVPAESRNSSKAVIDEVLSITQHLKDVVPNIHIIVRSRALSSRVPVDPVVLLALDEPACNKFTLSHPSGRQVPEAAMAAGEIYRMSNGRPGIINQILSKLSYTPFMDLANETSELAVRNINVDDLASSLTSAIDRLYKASNNDLFQLLACLSVFPYGEDIVRLKYFRKNQPFYPVQTGQLVNIGLVDAITHSFFEREKIELPKIVNAIRPAQLYVRYLSRDRYKDLTEKAIALYFGKDWRLKDYKIGSNFSRNKLNEFEHATLNANTLLRRFFNDSLISSESGDLLDSLGLLSFYTKKMDTVCHHREICNLCYLVVPKLKENIKLRLAQDVLFRYANSLRILDDDDKAVELYEYLLGAENQTRQRRASIYLNLAMLHDDNGNASDAVKFAKMAKDETDKKAATYRHADSIIIGRSNSKHKILKLQRLNRACLRDSHFTTANNIELRIAAYLDSALRKDICLRMANRALQEKDIFNYVKSTINYASLALEQGDKLSHNMLNNLKGCYDYVRAQRKTILFDRAHISLWQVLHERGDLAELAHLFSLSSVTYRLAQDEKKELNFLKLLLASGALGSSILEEDRLYIMERMNTYEAELAELAGQKNTMLN